MSDVTKVRGLLTFLAVPLGGLRRFAPKSEGLYSNFIFIPTTASGPPPLDSFKGRLGKLLQISNEPLSHGQAVTAPLQGRLDRFLQTFSCLPCRGGVERSETEGLKGAVKK